MAHMHGFSQHSRNTWANDGKVTQSIIAEWKSAKRLTNVSNKCAKLIKLSLTYLSNKFKNFPNYLWQVYQTSLTCLWNNFDKFIKLSLLSL